MFAYNRYVKERDRVQRRREGRERIAEEVNAMIEQYEADLEELRFYLDESYYDWEDNA